MSTLAKSLFAAGCLMALSSISHAGSDWLKGTPEQQLKTLADIQPGLGTIMIEYGHRFATMYYAAKGGNWDMASYQLKEMTEIQEVGEKTRPARAPMLKSFEETSLAKLGETIKAKDWKKFQTAYTTATQACNGCHAANGFGFIKYELPKASPSLTADKP